MTQHAGLSLERWSTFTLSQQILMIGNEMDRAGKWEGSADHARRRGAYERALYLTDLTIQAHPKRGLRRELLRWRDLLAELYVHDEPQPSVHKDAFRALLWLTPEASLQIPHVLG